MRAGSFIPAVVGAMVLFGPTLPVLAAAYDDHDRGRRDEHHDDWHRGYAPPPVVVAPQVYGHYAPPPVYN